MDLGLDKLTDDQLLELLQQACQELTTRDPFVRNLAQAKIVEESDKVAIMRREIKTAIESCRQDYIRSVREDVKEQVVTAYEEGKLRLLEPAAEANLSAEAEVIERIRLIDAAIKTLKSNDTNRFAFEITHQYMAFHHDGKNYQMAHRLAPVTVDKVGKVLRDLLDK